MKILFLTPQLPYPAISGGLIKTFKMIEFLSLHHELEVGFFIKDPNSLKDLKHLQDRFPHVSFFYEFLNRPRTAMNFFKSLLFQRPLSVYRNSSSSFQRICLEKSEKCDVIFIDHFLMYQYVPDRSLKKIILHEHNAEYLMWERYASSQTNWLKKIIIQLESLRIRQYEKTIIENSTTVLAAPNDIEKLRSICVGPVNFVETYHLGEDYLLSEPDLIFDKTNKSLLYIGTLSWEANREGLYWFLENVWPNVVASSPDTHFDIIGKDPHPDYFRQWHNNPNITWHGFVDDLRSYYSKARVFVSPLNFGSGIKVKVVNALYRGLPCVTTQVGVEGLDLKYEEEIMVADDPLRQSQFILDLLQNRELWTKISRQSRRKANDVYSWDQVLKTIKKVVDE